MVGIVSLNIDECALNGMPGVVSPEYINGCRMTIGPDSYSPIVVPIVRLAVTEI